MQREALRLRHTRPTLSLHLLLCLLLCLLHPIILPRLGLLAQGANAFVQRELAPRPVRLRVERGKTSDLEPDPQP